MVCDWRLGRPGGDTTAGACRGGDGGEVLQGFAVNRVSQYRQTPAFRIGQRHPFPFAFHFQDAISLTEIADDLILMGVDCGGQPGDQGLEDHGRTAD